MTSEQISALAGLILSLSLAYIPGLSSWYSALENPKKVFVTGIVIVVAAVGSLAWNCRADPAGLVACLNQNYSVYLSALIAALVANQASFTLLVKPFKKK